MFRRSLRCVITSDRLRESVRQRVTPALSDRSWASTKGHASPPGALQSPSPRVERPFVDVTPAHRKASMFNLVVLLSSFFAANLAWHAAYAQAVPVTPVPPGYGHYCSVSYPGGGWAFATLSGTDTDPCQDLLQSSWGGTIQRAGLWATKGDNNVLVAAGAMWASSAIPAARPRARHTTTPPEKRIASSPWRRPGSLCSATHMAKRHPRSFIRVLMSASGEDSITTCITRR